MLTPLLTALSGFLILFQSVYCILQKRAKTSNARVKGGVLRNHLPLRFDTKLTLVSYQSVFNEIEQDTIQSTKRFPTQLVAVFVSPKLKLK